MTNHSEILSFLRRHERARQDKLDVRFCKARRDFERIVQFIISDHQPKRIWQWGSLLDRRKFTEISDLDIAIEGLASAQEIFEITAQAEEMTALPLDIVEMEKIAPEYRALIQRKGRLVHGSA